MLYIRLRKLRKENNLTQKDISQTLEISQSLYSLYESGKKNIPISIFLKLAKEYNTSIDFLIGDTDIKTPFAKN